MAATHKSLLSLRLSSAREAVTADVRHLRRQLDVPARLRGFCRQRPWSAMGLGAAAGGVTGFAAAKAAQRHARQKQLERLHPTLPRPGPPPWLKALGFAFTFAKPVAIAWLAGPKKDTHVEVNVPNSSPTAPS